MTAAAAAIDATFVINLDASTGRWTRVRERCQKLGLGCTRFPAVDGRKLTDTELLADATPSCAARCTPAMVGCALSHIRLWKHALAKQYTRVLVLEDDVAFKEDFWPTLHAALAEVPEDFDILLLGCFNLCDADNQDRSVAQTFMRYNLNPASLNKKSFKSDHVYAPEFFSGTHAYIVSAQGLRKLLRAIPKADNHIDWSIAEAHRDINIYAVKPNVAYQESMMESTTATYGFPGTLNALLSTVRDHHNIELAYYLNVAYRRIGTMKTNVQLNAWYTIFFYLGLFGLPWEYLALFAIVDVALVPPTSSLDVAAKLATYAAGLGAHRAIVRTLGAATR